MKKLLITAMFVFGTVACATQPGDGEDETTGEESASAPDETASADESASSEEVGTTSSAASSCSHGAIRQVGAGCCGFLWGKQEIQTQMCFSGTWHNMGSPRCTSNRCGACSAGRAC